MSMAAVSWHRHSPSGLARNREDSAKVWCAVIHENHSCCDLWLHLAALTSCAALLTWWWSKGTGDFPRLVARLDFWTLSTIPGIKEQSVKLKLCKYTAGHQQICIFLNMSEKSRSIRDFGKFGSKKIQIFSILADILYQPKQYQLNVFIKYVW